MNLSVIIVSWNVREKLRNNLRALYQSEGDFSFEVSVVDNNSADGSADMVKQESPKAKVIANSENLGFSRANNQAIKLAQGEFILLLNPDMQVEAGTLAKTLAWAKNNPQATVMSCRLVDEAGKTIRQVRRFPKFFDQLMVTLKIPHIFPAVLHKYLVTDFNYEAAAKVDSVRGAFFLINRENWQRLAGGQEPLLDERYFLWFEEVDFCRQVYQLGGEVWYTPVAECHDYVGQSFAQLPRGTTQKYFSDSMLKYFEKWNKPWEYATLKTIWRTGRSLARIFVK